MEEYEVVSSVKKFLEHNKWKIEASISPGRIDKERFFPDILAFKKGKMLTVECKGSINLDELVKGIGQCIEHVYYGSNIICLAVPNDIAEKARALVKPIAISGGKIGLLIVNRNKNISIDLLWKELKLTKKLKELGKQRRYKLAFVRDLRIKELGIILKIADENKGNYSNKAELNHILMSKKIAVFNERKSISKKSILNALITPTNLGLMDNSGNLTEEGYALREAYEKGEEAYKNELAAYLLTKGSWLILLRIIEEAQLKFRDRKSLNKLTNLIEKYELIDKTMNKLDYAKRIQNQYFKWLKELDLVSLRANILIVNWTKVVSVLQGKIDLKL